MNIDPKQESLPDNNNLKSLRNNAITFILSVFIVLILSFTLTATISINNSLKGVYSKFIAKDSLIISKTINSYIESNVISLKDISYLPIIVNSVMRPENDHSFLKDFMKDLKIQGNDSDMFLLDINGKIIQQDNDQSTLFIPSEKWIHHLIDDNHPHYIRFYPNKEDVYIHIAVPVKYNGFTEGTLVATIKSKLESFLNLLLENDRQYSYTIKCDEKTILEANKKIDSVSIKNYIDMPLFNGSLLLEIDQKNIDEAIRKLIFIIIFIVISLSLLLFLPLKRLGTNLLVKPQTLLERSRRETENINRKLSIANHELNQFAYRTSHDLKAPMITINGLCDFIIEDIHDGEYEDALNNLNKIKKNSKNLEDLTSNILSLSKIENIDDEGEIININTIIDSISEKIELMFQKNDVSISFLCNHKEPLVTQKIRLTQILENLISNAIKYSDPKKEQRFIKIETTNDERFFTLSIQDNGLGIPLEYQNSIYEMFSRFHTSASSGSGLGLYIVKKHADILNAKIEIQSSPKGSCFTLKFPIKFNQPNTTPS